MNNALITLLAIASLGNVSEMPNEYTLLCEGQQSIGFNWRGGKWVETRFNPSRYIVAKIDSNQCRVAYGGKFQIIPNNGAIQDIGGLYRKPVCLNVRDFEDEYSPFNSQPCIEQYYIENGKWDRSFSCDRATISFIGSFEGEFHRAFNHGDTSSAPRKYYKDSLAIEVGRCTKIS